MGVACPPAGRRPRHSSLLLASSKARRSSRPVHSTFARNQSVTQDPRRHYVLKRITLFCLVIKKCYGRCFTLSHGRYTSVKIEPSYAPLAVAGKDGNDRGPFFDRREMKMTLALDRLTADGGIRSNPVSARGEPNAHPLEAAARAPVVSGRARAPRETSGSPTGAHDAPGPG